MEKSDRQQPSANLGEQIGVAAQKLVERMHPGTVAYQSGALQSAPVVCPNKVRNLARSACKISEATGFPSVREGTVADTLNFVRHV